tara:strand:- start:16 stop:270 length:255 start_codon:yes stop_codon:yes gene_type:complete
MTIRELIDKIDEDFFKVNSYYLSITQPELFAEKVAIEFAKYHVQLALENVNITIDEVYKIPDCNAYPPISNEVVLNSYPDTNIK